MSRVDELLHWSRVPSAAMSAIETLNLAADDGKTGGGSRGTGIVRYDGGRGARNGGDGSKGDTVDTKEIIQNRSEMKTQAIDDVLNMP